MNFEAVRNHNGQRLEMYATILEIGKQGTTKNGSPYCQMTIADKNGEKHNVSIFVDTILPSPVLLGKNYIFDLQTYQGKFGLAYSGYIRRPADIPALSAANQPAKNFVEKAFQEDSIVLNQSETIRIRSMAISYAKDLIVANCQDNLFKTAENIYSWIIGMPITDDENKSVEMKDEDIPF